MFTPRRTGEAGFTIIEVMVTAALFALVSMALFEVVRQSQSVTARLAERHNGYLEIRRFADRLRSEALTAEAITVPTGACKEVQFFMRDAAGVHFWSYRLNGAEIDRYAAAGPIAACTADPNIETVVRAVATFGATDFSIAQLAGRADTPFVNAIAANSGRLDAKIDVHVLDASGSPVFGGNHMVEISVENEVASYSIDLSPGVKPSGYDKVLTYTCGSRGGCGRATPPPGLLAGADISDCGDTQKIVAAAPASFQDVTCPDGKGLCTYVRTWNVSGEDDILYFSSRSGTQRAFPDAWNIPALGPYPAAAADQVTFNPQGNPVYPVFMHATDAIAAAADPSRSSNAGIQSDRTACSDVHGEAYYQNV